MLAKLSSIVNGCQKPVVCCFLGADELPTSVGGVEFVRTIDQAVHWAIGCIEGGETSLFDMTLTPEEMQWVEIERRRWSPEQKYLRGIFAGGTFCYQCQQIFQDSGMEVYSNAPLDAQFALDDPDKSLAHSLVDMGDEYYTLGKPHPMIDYSIRNKRIIEEANDPETAVIFFDIVLGYGPHKNPLAEIVPVIQQAKSIAANDGRYLSFICSVTGTDRDPQNRMYVVNGLKKSGALVMESNAAASKLAVFIIKSLKTEYRSEDGRYF